MAALLLGGVLLLLAGQLVVASDRGIDQTAQQSVTAMVSSAQSATASVDLLGGLQEIYLEAEAKKLYDYQQAAKYAVALRERNIRIYAQALDQARAEREQRERQAALERERQEKEQELAKERNVPPPVTYSGNIPDLIRSEFAAAGLDGEFAVRVAACESGFNPQAVGDNGTSLGLFQLHSPGVLDRFLTEYSWDDIFSAAAQVEFVRGYVRQNGWGAWSCA